MSIDYDELNWWSFFERHPNRSLKHAFFWIKKLKSSKFQKIQNWFQQPHPTEKSLYCFQFVTSLFSLLKKSKRKKNSFNLSRCLFNWNPFNGNSEEKVLISIWKVIVRDWVSEKKTQLIWSERKRKIFEVSVEFGLNRRPIRRNEIRFF